MLGDFLFQASRRRLLSYSKNKQPSWSYTSRVFKLIPFAGSFHASDIPFVFGILPMQPAAEMQSRWIAFANTLNRKCLP